MPPQIYRAVYIYGASGDQLSFSRWVTSENIQNVRDELNEAADANAGHDVEDPEIIGWEEKELEEAE